MITVSDPENVTITKVIKKTWYGDKNTRKALAGMHYIESDRSLKVITNKWKFVVKMTAEGYRVSGANKRVVFGSFTEVIDYIKSYY